MKKFPFHKKLFYKKRGMVYPASFYYIINTILNKQNKSSKDNYNPQTCP